MNTTKPKLSPQIIEEASHWFVEFNSDGDADTTTRSQFDAWLRRSPEHVQAYLQITALWENAQLLGKRSSRTSDELLTHVLTDSNVIPLGEIMSASPIIAAQAPKPGAPAASLRPQASGLSRFYATAATILVLLGTASWLYLSQHGVYTTGIGEQRSIALEDGTTIELNSRSKLRVRYNESQRGVELKQGQALFHVARDPTRPFIVESNGTQVRAVGTQFDVYRKTTGTVVTVLEGKVTVSAGILASAGVQPSHAGLGSQVSGLLLTAGEQLTVPAPMLAEEPCPRGDCPAGMGIEPPVATATPTAADLNAATAWTRRQLVFRATPLRDVIGEFNRYNTRAMVIADPVLEATRISGAFSSADPDPLLTFLRDLPDVRVDETAHEIRISRKRD